MNLIEYVQGLYTETTKHGLREIKDIVIRETCRIILRYVHNIVKMSILSKLGLQIQCNPNQKVSFL